MNRIELPSRQVKRVVPGVLSWMLAAGFAAAACLAGPLNPPAGPVGSTGKTVQEIYDKVAAVSTQVSTAEPRIAVNATNTPGTGTSVFFISQPGSYYLTGNVTGVSGKYGIVIGAQHVTLDLNGFEVKGVVGANDGIWIGSGDAIIRNGTVDGWPGTGVLNVGTPPCTFDRLIVENCGTGIQVFGRGSMVTDTVTSGNTNVGLYLSGVGSIAVNCTANLNGSHGFQLGNEVRVTNCTAYSNTGSGFSCADNSEVRDCHATSNGADGIALGFACTAWRCHANSNGVYGISAGLSCRVSECFTRAQSNAAGGGILLYSGSALCSDNVCQANARGIVATASSNTIVRNMCTGGTQFVTVSGNRVGTIVNPTSSGAISGSSGGGLGTTDPNANFAY